MVRNIPHRTCSVGSVHTSAGHLGSNRLVAWQNSNQELSLGVANLGSVREIKVDLSQPNQVVPAATHLCFSGPDDYLSEIQTVDSFTQANNKLLGTIDACGKATLYSNTGNEWASTIVSNDSASETSWAGINLAAGKVFTAHALSRLVRQFDIGTESPQIVNSFYCSTPPTAIGRLMEDGNTLFIAERSLITIWDTRTSAKNVQLQCDSTQNTSPCYSIAAAESVLACGNGRSVRLFDTRKWKLVTTWSDCTKHDLTWVRVRRQHVYVAGLDRELMCGRLEGQIVKPITNHFSFRASGNWIGLAMTELGLITGVTDAGYLHVMDADEIANQPSDVAEGLTEQHE
eukprot:c4532_g1_i1.p1 GENE.c4532_g1_i1~~c4532_g1_i1.p1  ORF type:complete len:344 (+),score=53.90 c4532_g1_i1:42-1073(+)